MYKLKFIDFVMICFLLGIFIASKYSFTLSYLLWIIPLILFSLRHRYPRLQQVSLLVVALLLGNTYTSSWRRHRKVEEFKMEKKSYIGVISQPPDIRPTQTLLTVLLAENNKQILLFTDQYPERAYGDQISFEGVIEKPEKIEDFDYPLYLEKNQVYGLAKKPKKLKLLERNRGSTILSLLYKIRTSAENKINSILPEPTSSFLSGILLGSKRSIPQEIQDNLKITGTTHIVAISGANITILLSLLESILPIYKKSQKFVVITFIAIFITLLTGASASVVRGAVIAILGSFLALFSRRAWPTPFILFSMSIMLLNNPLLLVADPGFQLSFGAFAGLTYLSPLIEKVLDKIKALAKAPPIIVSSFVETLAASLGTFPITLFTFGQASFLGLIVNPLILWLLPSITVLGLTILLLGWIPIIPFIIQMPLWFLLHSVLKIVEVFSWKGLEIKI